MHRDERLTYALTAGTAAAVGHTLIAEGRPRNALTGIALLAVAAEYHDLARPSASPALGREAGPDVRR